MSADLLEGVQDLMDTYYEEVYPDMKKPNRREWLEHVIEYGIDAVREVLLQVGDFDEDEDL